jgi:hypothetical protein
MGRRVTDAYDHIRHKVGCPSISWTQRQSPNRPFRKTCLRFGLPLTQRLNDGNDSLVDDYVVQAGVAHDQLKHLATAFFRGELEFEVHAIVARAHFAQREAEMARDRFGFLECHGFVKSSSGSTGKGLVNTAASVAAASKDALHRAVS